MTAQTFEDGIFAHLTAEYLHFLERAELPEMSADELVHELMAAAPPRPAEVESNIAWLLEFSERWDAMEKERAHPLYRKEFPDYPQGAIPALPAGWEDCSWHNDACPSFQCEFGKEEFAYLYVDYPDAAAREFPESVRFTCKLDSTDEREDFAAHSDSLDEVLAALYAYQVKGMVWRAFKDAGFAIEHTGGNCRAWGKVHGSILKAHHLMVTDEAAGLGDLPSESYALCVYAMLGGGEEDLVALVDGDQAAILAATREFESDPAAFIAAHPSTL